MKSYHEKDCCALWHPYTRHSDQKADGFPLIVSGEGVFLVDAAGNRYFDAISSWWACWLGHNHPRLVAALKEQSDKLQHSIIGNLSHPGAIDLAWRLSGMLGGDRHVLFASDGASAVEAALKIALQYWDNIGQPMKNRFLSFKQAYHGDTLGTMSVGYVESFHSPFKSALIPSVSVDPPRCHACPYGLAPDKCSVECLTPMEAAIAGHAVELAAVIVEPLCQGASGMNIYPPDYLAGLAALCAAHDVLLIVDEIATGFGRTGKMFAFEHAGISPDIVCLGKALSGGYLPISATVVKDFIHATFTDGVPDRSFYHGHTFAGNPLACAVALAALDVYEAESMAVMAEKKGKLMAELMSDCKDMASIRNTRFLGMIAALELEDAPGPDGRYPVATCVRKAMLEKSVLLRPLGNVVYLMPPIITPVDVISDTVEALKRAVQDL